MWVWLTVRGGTFRIPANSQSFFYVQESVRLRRTLRRSPFLPFNLHSPGFMGNFT